MSTPAAAFRFFFVKRMIQTAMNVPVILDNQSTVALFDRIYRHIRNQPIDDNASLLSGQMGYALLEAYAKPYSGEPDDDHIWERITQSLSAIQNGELTHSFAGGIAGVGWGFLHLTNRGLIQMEDAQEVVSGLDEALFELSLERLQNGDYDYLHGGLSAGLYFLERQPSPTIAQYVTGMVEALSATAIRYSNGDITWRFEDLGQPKTAEEPEYNPGLSHGTASIASMLSLFHERGYARQRCVELIRGTLQWMWNNRNRSGRSVFPSVVSEVGADNDSRLSWCYGDLGIANTFWLCGEKLQNLQWKSVGYETMLRTALRRSPTEERVNDAGFCHGSAGIAYLFRRFARQTGHPLLTETADYWMQQTVQYAQPETAENAFLTFRADQHYPNLGLLDGESSIGLVLLAELGEPAHWERFLLLS